MPFPQLSSPAILSPMAGVTDVAFRALCKGYGAGMTYTEFVSSAGLTRGSERTQAMLTTDPSESPVAVQLFGSDTDEVIAAARAVAGRFDVIDINCGCPAWKVVKTGAGSALLNDPERVGQLVAALVAAVPTPITVKIRAGIDDSNRNAVEVARAAERAGAAAVAVHGRTQRQGYRGEADWGIIRDVKRSVKIPVIGNGDVFDAATFTRRLRESGCDAIMIARGAIGNPFLFEEINAALVGRVSQPRPSPSALFSAYAGLAEQYAIPFAHVKQHALSFTKGVEGAARIRDDLTRCATVDELRAVLAATHK